MKKLVYIHWLPLTDKLRDDFYITQAETAGYAVEYWDLSHMYFPNILQNDLSTSYVSKINNFSELEQRIASQQNEQTLYVLMISYEGRTLDLFSLLTKHKCRTAVFARGAVPLPARSAQSLLLKACRAIDPAFLITFLKNQYARLQKRCGAIKYYDFVFNAGELGFQAIGYGNQIDRSNSRIIDINSFDFDRFVQSRGHVESPKEEYVVFLDEYLPYHPDFQMLGVATVKPDEYYRSLNRFFDAVESKFDVKIVIAAHPKASLYKSQNPFDGRNIFFDKTAELTRFSKFVLAHCSTAISFAVLNQKPIFFIYNDLLKLKMPSYHHLISHFAKTLASDLINTDKFSIDAVNVNPIDQSKYLDYKYKYLTSRSCENKTSSEIFIHEISALA